jgi:hypothetical protein
MGNAIKSFAKTVAKGAIKGATSVIPVVGGALGDYINSKFAVGSFDIGSLGIDPNNIPEGAKVVNVNTPAQLKKLVEQNPEAAKKAGLTVQMINEGVAEAKQQSKAIGGSVFYKPLSTPMASEFVKPKGKYAKGSMDLPKEEEPKKIVKQKKPRSEAQKAATAKMLAALHAKRSGKK